MPRFYHWLLLVSMLPLASSAQHYNHLTLWTRLQVTTPLSKRWELMAGLHHRRQNNYEHSSLNFLESPLLSGLQTQLIYRNAARTVALIPWQATYFVSNTLLGKEEDFSTPQNREWRFAVGTELTQNIAPKWIFRQRILQEFRFFRSNQDRPVGRIRWRWQVIYALKPFVSVVGVTELVVHDPPQINGLKPFRFHQFWLGTSLMWRLNKKINLETGYTFIRTQRLSLIEIDNQNAMSLNLFVRL